MDLGLERPPPSHHLSDIVDGDPMEMSFPKKGSCLEKTLYVALFPVNLPLWITHPDPRNPKCESL